MKALRNGLGALGLAMLAVLGALALQNWMAAGFLITPPPAFSTFTTIFLGIFIEAAPFLLLGTLASGLVEVFISRERLQGLLPSNPVLGALSGGLMGLFFPVCECGVVPLTRRFIRKGMAPATGIAFMLASPVLNPIVIGSTYAAYGWGPMLYLRVGLSLLIAVATGLVFSLHSERGKLLKQPIPLRKDGHAAHGHGTDMGPLGQRFQQALALAAEEFFEMGRYFIVGAMLAALLQTLVPQSSLLALGSGPVLSVLAMIALAVLLSICSTVDAFVSLAFVGSFTQGSILAFLVFGPMVDIKSTLLYLQVFKPRYVVYLILLPLLMTILISVTLNLNVVW